MTPEAWGQVVSIALQATMAIVAGLVLPWVKGIAASLTQLKDAQEITNKQIRSLNRRYRRHDKEITALKERKCGGHAQP